MILGERVKKLRKSLGLTQKQFVNQLPGKTDQSYIGMIERGKQYPSLKMLERIGGGFFRTDQLFLPGRPGKQTRNDELYRSLRLP